MNKLASILAALLPPLSAGGPHTIKVTGNNAVTLTNILCGDVWLCTGQSNMAGLLRGYKCADTGNRRLYDGLSKAYPRIRLFKLKQDGARTRTFTCQPLPALGDFEWRDLPFGRERFSLACRQGVTTFKNGAGSEVTLVAGSAAPRKVPAGETATVTFGR